MKYLLFSSETEQVKQSIRLLRKYLTQGSFFFTCKLFICFILLTNQEQGTVMKHL
jgi:hypothetical protein